MKKAFALLTAVILFQTGIATAQSRHFSIPRNLLPASVSADVLNNKLAQLERFDWGITGAKKMTAIERVATVSNYDYLHSFSIKDSVALIYSQGRGSGFDFQYLEYDLTNSHDRFDAEQPRTSYINFDIARNMLKGGVPAIRRTYNGASKVIKNEDSSTIVLYGYDGSNKVTQAVFIRRNSISGSWDSTNRYLYAYNSSGYLILDSQQFRSPSAVWNFGMRTTYVRDGFGRPLVANLDAGDGSGGIKTFVQYNYSYTGSFASPSTILVKNAFSTPMLVNISMDTLGYTAGAMSFLKRYNWNGAAWQLYREEYRHLNSANNPDSVFFRIVNQDSGYSKLTYDAQDNPVSRMDYYKTDTSPYSGARWTYEPVEYVGINPVQSRRLEFCPNPARDLIHLNNASQGSYEIYNVSGQLVQSGKVQNGITVPVHLLPQGSYVLNVMDASGQRLTGVFVRQ